MALLTGFFGGGGRGLLGDSLDSYTPADAKQLTAAYPGNSPSWLELFTDPFGQKRPIPSLSEMIAGSQQQQPPAYPPADAQRLIAGYPNAAQPAPQQPNQIPPLLMSAGAPAALARESMPQAAQQPAPTTAAGIQPAAANAMAQAPMPQSESGFGERMNAGLNNLSSGGNPLAMLANVAQGFATGKRFDAEGKREANQQATMQAVYQSLQARGYDARTAMGMAQAAAIDPKVAEKILGEAYAIPKTAEELAVRRASMPGQGSGTGNAFDILTQKTAATKAGEVQGERTANAQMDLPSAVAQSQEALRLAQTLRSHKGREGNIWWHGKAGAYLPDASIPGNTDARDAVGILGQLKGGAFLEAFKALKGGGAITEVEGKKATDAIARMDRSQSKEEFDRALSDYEGVIRLGVDRANQLAGQKPPNNFQGNAMKPGQYDWTPAGGLKQRGAQ